MMALVAAIPWLQLAIDHPSEDLAQVGNANRRVPQSKPRYAAAHRIAPVDALSSLSNPRKPHVAHQHASPAFKTTAFQNGKFIEVSDESLKGKWSVLIFMPAAFTFNCPTEVEDAADNYAAFKDAGAEVYIVTTDTHFSRTRSGTRPAGRRQGQVPAGRRPDPQLTRAFGAHRRRPGAARHLHHQPGRRDQDRPRSTTTPSRVT